jgi:hypothetical protein
MSGKLVTRFLTEAEYPCWNELVKSSPEGSIYSTPEYLDVLCGETAARFRILVADRAGEIVGGIGLFERSARWGTYATGRLLLYYNGIVLKPHTSKYPSECTARQLETLTALEEAITGIDYGRVEIKGRSSLSDVRVFIERGWRASPSYSYVAPLTDPKALWSRVEQNLRRLVGRCEREDVRFSEDDDFDSFYRLHQQTHVRKGAALYLPEAGFRRYFERLRAQNLCRLFQARTAEGKVMAAQLVLLGSHPVCHTVSAATDVEFLKTGVTAFLRWKSFEHLAQMGYAGNDLTDAQLNPVTHFKSQLGGDLQLNLVLRKPDRGGFRLENFVYRTGSMVKGGVRAALAPLQQARKGSTKSTA